MKRKNREIDQRPDQFKFTYHRNKNTEVTERFISANDLAGAWESFHYLISKDTSIEDIHVNAIYKYDEYRKEGSRWVEIYINDLNT